MKIICDTNIWYEFASGDLDYDRYKHLNLIPTYTSLNELVITEKLIGKFDLVKEALKYLLRHRANGYFKLPFIHIAELNRFTGEVRNDGLKKFFEQADLITKSNSIVDLGSNYTLENIKSEKKYRYDVPVFIKLDLDKQQRKQFRAMDKSPEIKQILYYLVNGSINFCACSSDI